MARLPDELGAHMSIVGGLHRALERGAALDCGAVQICLKNQRCSREARGRRTARH